MIDFPYIITYFHKDRPKDFLFVHIYAREVSEARSLFYNGYPGCQVFCCEPDAKKAEEDLAGFLAFRAMQKHPNKPKEARMELMKMLAACKIDHLEVRESVARLGMEI